MFGVQTILSTLILAAVPTADEATLLFVTTPGCVPCKQVAPLIQEIAEMGFPVQTVDASKHADLVQNQLKVRQFPTLLMLSHDKIVDRFVPTGDPAALKPRIMRMFERAAQLQQDFSPVSAMPAPHTASAAEMPTFAPIPSAPTTSTAMPVSFTTPLPTSQENIPLPSTFPALNPSPETLPTANSAGLESFSSWIASSVKLRVDAENTHSWGTGTIIDTRKGEALVLTCGHIFRDSKGAGKIEVHLFGSSSSAKVFGRCLYYDLEIDLALVAISPPCPVRAIPIAPDAYRIQSGQDVLSVGCDNGANPTVRTHRVLSTDRIGTPTENALPFHYIQVSGAPVSGRSGGGLFAREGFLIGVCNTADPVENDGHFVPPNVIRMVLDKLQLSNVYQNPSLVDQNSGSAQETPSALLTPLQPLDGATFSPIDQAIGAARTRNNVHEVSATGMNNVERATLEEIQRRAQDGDEVILIVRSRRNPEIPSNVIILNGTSDQFLEALTQGRPSGGDSSVIMSSHSMPPEVPGTPLAPIGSGPQTVSFPVLH